VINSNVMCAKFADADYLAAAQAIVVEHGPAAATVASISERLRAPTGLFYHRFASRDVLLGKLWLKTIGRARAAVHEPGVGTFAPYQVATWHVREQCYIDRRQAAARPGKDDPDLPSLDFPRQLIRPC